MTRELCLPRVLFFWSLVTLTCACAATIRADVTSQRTLSAPIDVSADFRDFANTYFVAESVAEFDPATGEGKLGWKRSAYTWGMSFDNTSSTYEPLVKGNEWPRTTYAVEPTLSTALERRLGAD